MFTHIKAFQPNLLPTMHEKNQIDCCLIGKVFPPKCKAYSRQKGVTHSCRSSISAYSHQTVARSSTFLNGTLVAFSKTTLASTS